jgi:sugar O-acyltransferase (sialic acid O-acetyltransferase NeuD family)
MKLPILIVAAGGHASVVADALLAAGEEVLGFVDADPALHGSTVCSLPVLGDDRVLDRYEPDAIRLVNGIGSTRSTTARRDVQQRIEERGWRFVSVRHPTATVSRFARVAESAQLLAASVVQVDATISAGCIVNTAAVVEHGVSLDAWVHVAPRAIVCGDVHIGAGSHIGAGAVVRQGIRLGEQTIVGAGAVVVRSFDGGGLLVGVPARRVDGDL